MASNNEMPRQLRYTEEEVERIKSLFVDADGVKLYRKYLLDLPLNKAEKERIQMWAHANHRYLLQKCTLPLIEGEETIGIGYDVLNNVSLKEVNYDHQERFVGQLLDAIEYLQDRLDGLDNLKKSCTGKGKWLTAAVLDKSWSKVEDKTSEVLRQLNIRQNVEGVCVGINAVISLPTESKEDAAKRKLADSTR